MVRLQLPFRRWCGSGGRQVAGLVARHEPTGRYLGAGLTIDDLDDATTFASADEARRFLDRFACEPSFVLVPAGEANAA